MTYMSGNYILDGHTPVEEPDFERYIAWKTAKRDTGRVARTVLPNGRLVSTVFLGMDHGFGERPPVLFETMVFTDESCGESLDMDRYCTWEQAERGHAEMVAKWSVEQPEEEE